jgi:oligopeptide transport system permease protein
MGQALAQAERPDISEPGLASNQARGLWSDAWRRLRKNRAAVIGLVYIGFMILVAIFGPLLAPHDPNNIPMGEGFVPANLPPFWQDGSNPDFLLGTDSLARDNLSRYLYGARVSMIVGIVPTIVTFVIGVTFGMVSGWLGGRWDDLMMRIVDVVYAFPSLLLFIIMQASLRDTQLGRMLGGLMLLFIAFAITGWNGTARLMRGQVLSVREKEYVEAARAIGMPSRRILLRHVFPNSMAPLIVSISFSIPGYILSESSLSFLGLGIRPPNPSWGSMVFQAFPTITYQPIFVIMPTLLIAFIMIAFAFVGDGLRDALDPQSAER